jgi:methionine synthase II (cobalamin-independent)
VANPGRYRADHIGSLKRPAALAALPANAPAAQRQALIESAIGRAVALQRDLGLNIVSDGEMRRSGPTSALEDAAPGRLEVEDEEQRLRRLLHSAGGASVPIKITLPAPSAVPAPLIGAWRRAIEALIAAGVNCIQLQSTGYARALAEPGAAVAFEALLAADASALEDLEHPEGVRVAFYLGRGTAARVGLFDTAHAVFAHKLLATLAVERFVLDVDHDATGGFSALEHVPAGTSVALGLISTRTPQLEERDAILDRLDAAAAHLDGDFLALCPQSGFAESALSEDEQRRKLELVVSVSTRYWGFEA